MVRSIAAGLVLCLHAAWAEPQTVTLPSGDTVAVVKPTLSTRELDLRLQKAIDALSAGEPREQKAVAPETTTNPPILTGYSLYPR